MSKRDTIDQRGYGWTKRSKEIRERDEKICQRCGDHNGKYEYNPVVFETHHIIPGECLEIDDARVDLNLVNVCSGCHSKLEGKTAKRQFEEMDRSTVASILNRLESGRCTVSFLSRAIDMPQDQCESILNQLEAMRCVRASVGSTYTVTNAAVERAEKERLETRVEELEELVEDPR